MYFYLSTVKIEYKVNNKETVESNNKIQHSVLAL